MQNSWTEFFGSNKVLSASSIIGAVLSLLFGAFEITQKSYGAALNSFIIAATVLGIWLSFRAHEKKIMQNLMSVLTAVLLVNHVNTYADSILSGNFSAMSILQAVSFLLLLDLLINNLGILSEHHTNPSRVTLSQIVLALLLLISLVILMISFTGDLNLGLCAPFAMVFYVLTIVSIETKLDLYKAIRDEKTEEGSWDEDTKQQAKDEVFGK